MCVRACEIVSDHPTCSEDIKLNPTSDVFWLFFVGYQTGGREERECLI